MLSNDLIKEFQIILKDELDYDVDSEKASEMAYSIVSCFDLLEKIDRRNDK
jgi:hypothetical protein